MSRFILLASALIALVVSGPHARSADDAKDEAVKRFKEALQGKWQMTSRIVDGVPSEAEAIKSMTVTFVGDSYTLKSGEKTLSEVSYKIDPTKKPAWLDAVAEVEEPGKGKIKQKPGIGIIKLEGDTLTFCVGVEVTRPGDFKSEKGGGRLLVEFKRVKK